MANNNQIKFNYSKNLVNFLELTKLSLVMSNYQANKVMIIGAYNGNLDIRYKNFQKPMGMCATNGKIFAGFKHMIWEFHNFENAAKKIDINRDYDACYLPLNIHITGNIDIHEMEYLNNELYFINTQFSALCKLQSKNSFKPIWKPPFISELLPIDKCHLNGLCSRDNEPRYVTALGKSDEPLGWRKNKTNGGILMDIKTNKIILDGLSMPHSPRWYKNRLWYMESGKGTLSYIDLKNNKTKEVAKIPGFTRGLYFLGDFAFVGVSKVRESATFSGLPITKLPKRVSGIWVIDINSGNIVTFIEFTEGIDEVFSVLALPYASMDIFDYNEHLSINNYLVDPEDLEKVKMPKTPIELAAPYFDKGNDLYTEGKKEEAIESFKKALEIQPDYLPATFNIAITLGDLGRYDEALDLLNSVIEKDASIAQCYNSLGYIYYKQKNYIMAKKNFEIAIDLDPNYVEAKTSLLKINNLIKCKKD